jgi:CO dehydrogenase nickel-insertion accessory protein CooC1
VAETIYQVAREVSGQDQAGLLLNRVRSAEEINEVQARTRLEVIGGIPEDETIRRFDTQELSFFDLPECPAATAIWKAMERLGILK